MFTIELVADGTAAHVGIGAEGNVIGTARKTVVLHKRILVGDDTLGAAHRCAIGFEACLLPPAFSATGMRCLRYSLL